MERRTYLGGCVGAGLAALSGCLGTIAPRVTRTEASPAFLLPSVGGGETGELLPRDSHLARRVEVDIDTENDAFGIVPVRGWLTGSRLVAANYNNTRSNRSVVAPPDLDMDADGDGLGDVTERAQNHNSSRSNRTSPVAGDGDLDLDRAFAYLTGDAVVAETFVVSVPVVDLPGIDDPAARANGADYLENMAAGARAASPTSNETALQGLTAPTLVRPVDAATPYIYTSSARDDDTPVAGGWTRTRLPGRGDVETEHEPVVGRAVATLADGVRIPVLVHAQHLVSGGDHLFVAGWVVDDARLYTTAATALVAAGRTRVLSLKPEAVADPAAAMGAAGLTDRQRSGASGYQDGDDLLLRKRPGRILCGTGGCPDDDATGLDEAARAALRPDPVTPVARPDEPVHLFALPVDAPLVHLAGAADAETVASLAHSDSWAA